MDDQNTTPPAHHVQTDMETPTPKRFKKKQLILITSIVAAILLGLGLVLVLKQDKTPEKTNNTNSNSNNNAQSNKEQSLFAQQNLQNCKERDVSFTATPVPIDQMGYMEPMGKTNDGHVTPTDHVYISPKSMTAADNTTDVVMPADGTVINVAAMPAQYIGDSDQQTAPEDHRLTIAHNCKYVSIFIHIHQLSDALKKVVGTIQPNENKQVSIELKAGDKLGKIGGNPVDWSLMDVTKKLNGFITPKLYEGEPWKIHVIDPVSIYSGSLKEQLIAKSVRTVEPYGGKIDYDKQGALVGNWFREGTNGYSGKSMDRYWDGHLSIAPNYIDPEGITVSLGNWNGKATQFTAEAKTPKPETVTKTSGVVKYELVPVEYINPGNQPFRGQMVRGAKLSQTGAVQGTVVLQVLDGEKLKVELFPGKTAAQVSGFTATAQTYER